MTDSNYIIYGQSEKHELQSLLPRSIPGNHLFLENTHGEKSLK